MHNPKTFKHDLFFVRLKIVEKKIKESKYGRVINVKLLYCFSFSHIDEKLLRDLNSDANS